MKSTVYTYCNVDRVRASLNGMMSEKKVVWGYVRKSKTQDGFQDGAIQFYIPLL